MANHFDSIPVWDGQSSSLDAYDERVRLFIMSTKKDDRYLCGPRLLSKMEPESDMFRLIRGKLTDEQLSAEDGSGAKAIIVALRSSLGPKSMQEAVKLFLHMLKLDGLRRLQGESMKKWTTRFQLSLRKVGTALHAACKEIPADGFLHPMIQGIILAETSGLTPSEFASVLGTSGTSGAEGEKIGNSWMLSDLIEAFCDQWSDDAVALRDSRSRRSDSIGAAMEEYALSEWEPVDEQYYEYDEEPEIDFSEGVFGEQYVGEGHSSQPVVSEGHSSQLERFTEHSQASAKESEH